MERILPYMFIALFAVALIGCGSGSKSAEMPTAPQKYDPNSKNGPPPPGREAASKREGERGGRPSN